MVWCHAGLARLHRKHRADDLAARHQAEATALGEELGIVVGREPT
jgi:hypothetical protein